MPLITLGDDTKLKLKIPSKGDIDWSDDFKTQFAQKIVDHDHSGVDGKGKRLSGDSLADGAINRASILAIKLEDLPNVTDTVDALGNSNYSTGQVLIYQGGTGTWEPGSPTSDIITVNNTGNLLEPGVGGVASYAHGSTLITTDITADPYTSNDEINFTFYGDPNSGGTDITEYNGVTFIIDETFPAGRKVKFPALNSCVVMSNTDVEIIGAVTNSKILVRRANGTAELILSSNGSFEGCIVECDSLTSNAHTSSLTRFTQSNIVTDLFTTKMSGGTDLEILNQTNMKVGNWTNTTALSTGILRCQLTNKSNLSFNTNHSNVVVDASTLDISSDSTLSTLATIGSNTNQVSKVWDAIAERWQYVISPSGINKLISADSNGVPSEFSLTQGRLLKGGANGFESHQHILNNVDDVTITSPTTGQVLTYNGSQWIDDKQLKVNVIGTKDIDTTNASSTLKILQYNGTKFVPASLPASGIRIHDAQTFVKAGGSTSTNTVTIDANQYAVFSFISSQSSVYGAANRDLIVADSTTIVFTQSGYASTVSVGGVVVAGNNGTSNSTSQCILSVVVYENGA